MQEYPTLTASLRIATWREIFLDKLKSVAFTHALYSCGVLSDVSSASKFPFVGWVAYRTGW